jgi:poly(A) polymerase
VDDALRLSRAEAQTLARLRDGMAARRGPGRAGLSARGALARDILLLRGAMFGQPVDAAAEAELEAGARAVFPVKAADLMPGFSGPALGAELERLERLWIESGFRHDEADELGLSLIA